MTLSFFVPGLPVPQGSMKAFLHRVTKRPIITADRSKELRSWRQDVASAALKARGGKTGGMLDGPVVLRIEFDLPAPKSRPKQIRTPLQFQEWAYPVRRPDVDKLARAILDSLINVVIGDDGQVVVLSATKRYGEPAGAHITVEELAA